MFYCRLSGLMISSRLMDMTDQTQHEEEFKVKGEDLLKKIKDLIKKGNARRILIKNSQGETIIEVPLTIGAVGAVIAPALAAIGALAALLTDCTIVVIRKDDA